MESNIVDSPIYKWYSKGLLYIWNISFYVDIIFMHKELGDFFFHSFKEYTQVSI